MKLKTFNKTGCYIDGANGHEHAINKMKFLMLDISNERLSREIVEYNEDVCFNEVWDECIEALQEQTEEGLLWVMEAGDLLLVNENEWSI